MQMHITTKRIKFKQDIHQYGSAVQRVIDVNTGEVKVAHSGAMLRSVAVGSCVAVAALDSEKRIGAMAHIMLPGCAPIGPLEKTKYASDAIEQMLNQMFEAGASMNDIEVCLVGAGNVLRKKDDTICEANIESTMRILREKNIAVKASVLGGTERKSVFMDVENGHVSFTKGDDKEKILWQAGLRQLN